MPQPASLKRPCRLRGGKLGASMTLPTGSSGEVTVFVKTNLGTHLAFTVQYHITAGDFKIRLAWEHFYCFPDLGEVRIHALMVKQKSRFYHIPASMPIKLACQASVGSWFLHVEVSTIQGMPRQVSSCPASQRFLSPNKFQDDNDKSREVLVTQSNQNNVNEGSKSKMLSLPSYLNTQIDDSSRRAGKCRVGKRLVQGAKNIELSANAEKLRNSMFNFPFGFLSTAKSKIDRNNTFEFPDD